MEIKFQKKRKRPFKCKFLGCKFKLTEYDFGKAISLFVCPKCGDGVFEHILFGSMKVSKEFVLEEIKKIENKNLETKENVVFGEFR